MTAEEYLKSKNVVGDMVPTLAQYMKDFTVIHVQKALEKAAEEVTTKKIYRDNCEDHTPFWGVCSSCGNYHNPKVLVGESIDKESILNAYPIENIK